jgi:CDP-glycerol glycerophosphotransferase (TagB/SpsB family)
MKYSQVADYLGVADYLVADSSSVQTGAEETQRQF